MAINMDVLASQYQQYLNSASSKDVEKATKSDYSSASDEELMDACKQFESYFIEQIYKGYQEMAKVGNEEDEGAMGSLGSYYKEQLMQQYAEMTSEQGGLGLAQQLFEQMKRNYQL